MWAVGSDDDHHDADTCSGKDVYGENINEVNIDD